VQILRIKFTNIYLQTRKEQEANNVDSTELAKKKQKNTKMQPLGKCILMD